MTCFIVNQSVCRSYAKCHGWQETLAHFFVKSRRSQPLRRTTLSSISTDVMSTYTKDQSIDSGRESSSGTYNDSSNLHIPLVPPQVFETSSSPDDPAQGRLVRQLDLSPIIDENFSRSLSRTFSASGQSITSNSILTPMSSMLMDNKDATPEFLRRNSEGYQQQTVETIATPLRSSSASHEDLLSLVKTENSNDDVASIASSNDVQNPLPATTITSIKHLCDEEDNNKQHRRLGPELRQMLGRLIALL